MHTPGDVKVPVTISNPASIKTLMVSIVLLHLDTWQIQMSLFTFSHIGAPISTTQTFIATLHHYK